MCLKVYVLNSVVVKLVALQIDICIFRCRESTFLISFYRPECLFKNVRKRLSCSEIFVLFRALRKIIN